MANLNGMGPNEEVELTGRGLGKCKGNRLRRNMTCRPRNRFRNNQQATYDTNIELLREEIQDLKNQLENKQ